jgi:FdhD protein
VDKAIGGGLLAGANLARLGLVLSARVSADIAAKAARAGLAWIASRSVPTTLAVEIAEAAGIPIIARAAGPEARVFAGAPAAADGDRP